ncbi:unnamed protein product [Durusdinium trenchii]|uniref:Uncharacterized protein n=1 Tax=Durusdinium trenchii TaxID=1381693 RepID=A0ABP0QX99_9DINO
MKGRPCDLNAVGTKLLVEKPKRPGTLASSASLPPTRSSASTSFETTRQSHWSTFSSARESEWPSPQPSRCFSPWSLTSMNIGSLDSNSQELVEEPSVKVAKAKRSPSGTPLARGTRLPPRSGTLPKLERRPSMPATLQDWHLLDVVGSACSLASQDRRLSRSAVAPGRPVDLSCLQEIQGLHCGIQDPFGQARQREREVPLTSWLQEMGVEVDFSDLLVRGRGALRRGSHPRLSHLQRARLDRAFVEQLDRIARERSLPLEDLTQDLQIFRLKLHDRQARRRLHDIFGAKRRRAPPPEFAQVVPVEDVPVPKVKEPPPPASFTDDYIPRTPKAVVSAEVPQIVKEDPVPVPVSPVTPISRKPTPQRPVPEEVDEPIPAVVPQEESEDEEEVEEPTKPLPKPPPTPQTPKVQPKEVKRKQSELPEIEPPPPQVRELVVEPRGLFRVKEGTFLGHPGLLFPCLRASKEKSSKEVTLFEDDLLFQDSEKPQSADQSRPGSRRRFNLAEQFREALAAAWQRALQSLEEPRSFTERMKEKDDKDERLEAEAQEAREEEDEDSSDKELMETWTSLFSDCIDSDSTESLSLSERAKRLQQRRYRKRLLRRTRGNQARDRTSRCWTNRMEVCLRLLTSVDVLTAKALTPC